MKNPVSTLIGTLSIIVALVGGSHALSTSSTSEHSPKNTMDTSRRRFFRTSIVSVLSPALVFSAATPANAAWLDGVFGKKQEEEEFTYDRFRDLVQSKKIQSVQFNWNGSSLTCVDTYGKKRSLDRLPDDPTLLLALVNAGISPTVEDFPYEKHMSSSGWFRDSVLHDATLTDEEKYKYRGYKTFRQNIPENRVYIPSNLISN